MIKNIIFDIGNVCVTFHPAEYFITFFHDQKKTEDLCTNVFTHDAWAGYDQGLLSLSDCREIYHQDYPEDKVNIDYILDHWMNLMKPIPSTITLMQEVLKQGYDVYILSNISKDSADYLKRTQPFFQYAKGAVLSYEEQVIKPDVKIYECLFKRFSLQPEECLFIDDVDVNIEVARQLGMNGIVYHNAMQVEEELKKYLCEEYENVKN